MSVTHSYPVGASGALMNEVSEFSGRWYEVIGPESILVLKIAMGIELRLADFTPGRVQSQVR